MVIFVGRGKIGSFGGVDCAEEKIAADATGGNEGSIVHAHIDAGHACDRARKECGCQACIGQRRERGIQLADCAGNVKQMTAGMLGRF